MENKKDMNFREIVERSIEIRSLYQKLERQYHHKEWSIEEDALAFLTDAGLVGRLTMARENRWPLSGNTEEELKHKLGESIWWLIVLADRMNINIEEALDRFLTDTIEQLQ